MRETIVVPPSNAELTCGLSLLFTDLWAISARRRPSLRCPGTPIRPIRAVQPVQAERPTRMARLQASETSGKEGGRGGSQAEGKGRARDR
jgi:hypothetical protein